MPHRIVVLFALVVLSLAGCDDESPKTFQAEGPAPAVQDLCEKLADSKGLVLESREQQALADAFGQLADRLDADGEQTLAEIARGIADGLEESRQSRGAALYLRTGTTRTEAGEVERLLETTAGVADVTFVSSEAAYEEFRDLFEDQPEMYEHLGPNDLPPAFRFSPQSRGTLHEVRERLRDHPLVEEIRVGSKFGRPGQLSRVDHEQGRLLKATCRPSGSSG